MKHAPRERRLIELTAEVAREHVALERDEGVSHPSHGRDVAMAVHDVQRVVAMRLARRADPEAWS